MFLQEFHERWLEFEIRSLGWGAEKRREVDAYVALWHLGVEKPLWEVALADEDDSRVGD